MADLGRRAFVVVIDACGAGALPDAADYGDSGTDTLGHLAEAVGGLELPTLQRLGLGSITSLLGVPAAEEPVIHGRLAAIGPGKDSTAGHWGLMGVRVPDQMPTFPDGFPQPVTDLIASVSGRGVLCNRPYNGIAALEDFGEAHLSSGELIVYTSQDSVLQIAAHAACLPEASLYAICAEVRERLAPEHAVGRVIARPFSGPLGGFARGARQDFALAPPGRSYLEECRDAGVCVHTVGKAGQLMCGVGIDHQHPGATNASALANTAALMETLDSGLVFTNLVETDQLYGHRHDAAGFAAALVEIDAHVKRWLTRLGPDDLLVLTADHGCDVSAPHTDHTREYAPLLALIGGDETFGRRHDGTLADVGASALDWLAGRQSPQLPGTSFL